LASLPPEVEVPLPLGFGFIELPVVGEAPGVAELAAGSPVVEPRPLGAPPWACAKVPASANAKANAMVVSFMAAPPGNAHDNRASKQQFLSAPIRQHTRLRLLHPRNFGATGGLIEVRQS
jgi:hypothetical protein